MDAFGRVKNKGNFFISSFSSLIYMYLDKTKCISFLLKLLGSVSLYGVTVFGVIVMKFHIAGYMEAADSKVNTRILTT